MLQQKYIFLHQIAQANYRARGQWTATITANANEPEILFLQDKFLSSFPGIQKKWTPSTLHCSLSLSRLPLQCC